MYVVGLTGGIGSGKSTVAELFAKLGVDIVDADVAARQVVQPGSAALKQIAAHFGDKVIDDQGNLDRALLRQKVFADAAERKWLEQLLHPLIADQIRGSLAAAHSSYCILVSPLLLETSQCQLVNRVLVVDVSEAQQLQRTLVRDGGEAGTIEAIIAAQISREQRIQQADEVLDNSSDLITLLDKVKHLHQLYSKAAQQ